MQRNLASTNYRVLSSNVTNCQLTLLAQHSVSLYLYLFTIAIMYW